MTPLNEVPNNQSTYFYPRITHTHTHQAFLTLRKEKNADAIREELMALGGAQVNGVTPIPSPHDFEKFRPLRDLVGPGEALYTWLHGCMAAWLHRCMVRGAWLNVTASHD